MITRFINAGGFAFILICFLFPFISIKCNDTTLVTMKGYDMVFGKKNYLGNPRNIFDKTEKSSNSEIIHPDSSNPGDTQAENKDDDKDLKPSPLMIILMVVTVGGIIIALASADSRAGIAGLVISVLFLLVLLAIVINLHSKADKQSSEMFGIIRIGYEIGFWLMLASSLLLIGYNLFDILNIRRKAIVITTDAATTE